MGTVSFACTECGQTISASDEYAGQAVVCPSCSKEVIVPASGTATSPADPPRVTPPENTSDTAPDGATPEITCATCSLFDWLLKMLAKYLSAKWFEKNMKYFINLGLYGIYVAAGGAMLVTILLASKASEFAIFLNGVGVALVLLVLQYIATKFLLAGNDLIASTPSTLSTRAFLDCTGLLHMIAGIAAIILCTILSLQEFAPDGIFWLGFGIFAWCELIASISMHPSTINVTVKPGSSAGEEVLGILSFFMKAALKLTPIAFSMGIVAGIGIGIGALMECFGESTFMAMAKVSLAGTVLITSTALPLAMYIAFLVYHLNIELMRAVLSLKDRK